MKLLPTCFFVTTCIYCSFVWSGQCDALDPRQQVSRKTAAKIEGSAKTLYKVATAGGSVEGKLEEETKKIQEGVQDSEKSRIKERLIYLFCLTVTTSTELRSERKSELLKELQIGMLSESTASSQSEPQSRRIYLRTCVDSSKAKNYKGRLTILHLEWKREDGKWQYHRWPVVVGKQGFLTDESGEEIRSKQTYVKVALNIYWSKSKIGRGSATD